MEYTAGQVLVHPHHGPATVEEVIVRAVRGVSTQYLRLKVHRTSLVIGIPVAKAEEVGIRPVAGPEELARLFDVLRAPSGEVDPTWSRRFKDHHDKLRHGDLFLTGGVVRDLMRRQRDNGLSLGEKDLLKEARSLVVDEIALAMDITEAEAGAVLDAAALHVEPLSA
jgi:CarD family transcriptional regulator